MKLKERARDLKKKLPAVFMALKSSKTPLGAKILAALTVGYALSPVDLIPDFIPILGYLDDLIILPALCALTIKLIPNDVMNECIEKSADMWKDGKPKKWYFAIPFVLVWVIVIGLIVKAIFF